MAESRNRLRGGVRLCVSGLLTSAAAGVLLGVVDTVWGLILVSMLVGIGAGLGFTAGLDAYSRTVADDRQASAHGLMGATEVLLGGVTSVLGAWLYDISGRGLVWSVIPAMMALTLLAGLTLRSTGRQLDTPSTVSGQRDP